MYLVQSWWENSTKSAPSQMWLKRFPTFHSCASLLSSRSIIIKKTIKLCAESIYYSIFKCVTNTTALLLGCSEYFLSKHILPICTVPVWTFFKWCKIQEMWRSMHLVIKFLGVSQCHLVFHCGFVPDTHEIVIPRTLWGRKARC